MERSADRWARNHLSRTPPPSLPSLHASSRHGERHHFAAFSQGPKVERTKMERVRCPTFPERVSSAARKRPRSVRVVLSSSFRDKPNRPSSERVSSSPPLRRFTRCISGSYQLFIAHAPREGGRERERQVGQILKYRRSCGARRRARRVEYPETTEDARGK